MADKVKIIEHEMANDLKSLVSRGIKELKAYKGEFEPAHMVKLEKLTRAYSILMSDLRETVKNGLLGALDDDELDELD